MKVVRIVAEQLLNNIPNKHLKIMLVCGLSETRTPAAGEWFGTLRFDAGYAPFVFKDGDKLNYGGHDHESQSTNLGTKKVKVGAIFTVMYGPDASDAGETIFKITSCHEYN